MAKKGKLSYQQRKTVLQLCLWIPIEGVQWVEEKLDELAVRSQAPEKEIRTYFDWLQKKAEYDVWIFFQEKKSEVVVGVRRDHEWMPFKASCVGSVRKDGTGFIRKFWVLSTEEMQSFDVAMSEALILLGLFDSEWRCKISPVWVVEKI